ncbi:hypothetical protein Q3C01_42160 [Bradyrhizobium sp. UFLA05-109]
MSAQIIQFSKYQKSRELARMHSDIETSLAKLSEMAAQVFSALRDDAVADPSGVSARQQTHPTEPRRDRLPLPSSDLQRDLGPYAGGRRWLNGQDDNS